MTDRRRTAEGCAVDPTRSLPALNGPSTVTGAGADQASSTRPHADGGADTPPGEVLPRPFGRYELRRLLGRGGMGSVYLAHDAQLDRDVALKIPRPFGDNPHLWRERFLTEARAAATLSHPNICPVHDVGEQDGRPFLTMAYIDGDTLAAKLKVAGLLGVAEAVGVVGTVARAMADAHARGIVHRDLKPGNVMIDRRGRAVVMDFGLALRTDAADDLRVTLTGVAVGTPAYMPPEQAGGDADAIGPTADVYALGVILFELLTGNVPFKGRTFGQLLAQIERDPPPVPSSLNPDVHPALDGIILTALAKSPADRFPTAAELADVLEQFQVGGHDDLARRFGAAVTAALTTPDRTRPYTAPPKKRGGRLVGLAAGFVALLVLLAGAIYVSTDKGELKIEFLDPDTGKPIDAPKGIDVKVNGQRVVLDPDGKPVSVRAGEDQMLVVTGDDFVTESQTFTLKRWKDATVRVTLLPKERLAKRADDKSKVEVKPDPKPEEKPKPKPVEFPKDKTLIEAPGWQILTDATKEQMQAWLDEKRKAGHSVLWLDAAGVAGKPVFSAVASLDDRLSDWRAHLDVPVMPFVESLQKREPNLTGRSFLSLSGYVSGDTLRVAVLLGRGDPKWYAEPDVQRSMLGEADAMLKDDGFGYRVIRPYAGLRGKTAVALIAERTASGGDRAFDLSDTQLERFIADRRAEGQRTGPVAAYPVEGALKFATVSAANPGNLAWATDIGLLANTLVETAKERARAGFRPESVTAYAWDGAVRYCVVWVKDPPKPVPYPKDKVVVKVGGYETLLDATQEQMQTWLDEKKKAKHSVLWLDAVEVGGKPLFSAVAALDDRQPQWTAFLDVPAAKPDQVPEKLLAAMKANSFVALSGYASENKLRTALLLHPGPANAISVPNVIRAELARLDLDLARNASGYRTFRPYPGLGRTTMFAVLDDPSPARGEKSIDQSVGELATDTADRRKADQRPSMVTAYPVDGGVKYSAVWVPNSGKLDWATDTDLPAAKLIEVAKEKANGGFRPQSITACPWDGAVRYCVVWVKDPPKNGETKDPPPKK